MSNLGPAITGFILGALAMMAVFGIDTSQSEPKIQEIEAPSRLVSKPFMISGIRMFEFRNSQGGTCILATRSMSPGALAVACMQQLPPMDFENLPRPQ